MGQIKLAEALLRRKELAAKVKQLEQIKSPDLYVVKTGRKAAHEGIDDIIAQVPRVTLPQFTAAYDWHARRLRLIDAAIQQANWTCTVDVADDVMGDYAENAALSGAKS